jgi:hypothetical protein
MGPLVTVQTFSRVIDARLAQARLEGAGIRTFLLDESVASIDPFLINAIGGVKLQVELDDEQAARDLLSEPLDEPLVDDIDPSAPRCPRCDSEYVFDAGTASSEAGAPVKRMECKRCGHKGDAAEFAPKSRPPAAARAAARTQDGGSGKTPVFRLERRRGLLGGVLGFVAGFVVTVIFPNELGAAGLVVGMIAGYLIGRTRTYYVCSDPACRGPIAGDVRECARCHRALRGRITREGDHFVRVAEYKREQERGPSFDA